MDWDYKERIHFYLITQNQGDNTRTYKNEKIKIYRKEVLKELRPNLNHLYTDCHFLTLDLIILTALLNLVQRRGRASIMLLFFSF